MFSFSGFTKTLTKNTEKVYKTKLNKIAAEGYDTTEALMENPLKVIRAIAKHAKGSNAEELKLSKRGFLSAIFAVLPEDYRAKKNPFYRYYQTVLPSQDASSGSAWVKKTQYDIQN